MSSSVVPCFSIFGICAAQKIATHLTNDELTIGVWKEFDWLGNVFDLLFYAVYLGGNQHCLFHFTFLPQRFSFGNQFIHLGS
mmetsp:Transcript_19826/g.37279  ORF Transcript_19826/g.37279 Transcript_19826/m.37279 type:complete len:82 (+) Transcript_19826:574-819(+)